ncbi:hypothetical protein M2T59_31905, partial [Klebsiella pneumoniae]|nr:hypothetical protein [Klebsiella pneumoniae]
MTSFFRQTEAGHEGIRHGWRWNPNLYQRLGWCCRVVGWLILAIALFRLPTPSFVTFLIVKGILAMLAL